ncbi:hypothetical protein [Benzoatithermus flavus]|uniref:Uncharacterized protein n=1 Tax=Benzoatithermus flavus TaxID=3108223 RepID=A0ABU8XUP1_9PROT
MEPSAATPSESTSRFGAVLLHLGLYVFMLVWSVVGLFFTRLDPRYSVLYWEATTIVFALIAIARVLVRGGARRHVLALKQLAHWGAFLVAMLLLHTRQVTSVLTDDALGLVLLLLLALATFLDGLYVDWRFCVVGALLAIGVVVLAALSNVLLILLLLLLVGLAVLYFLRHLAREETEPGV